MTNSHHYLNNLTPLRGIAALWVAIFHFEISTINTYHYDHTKLLAKGYLLVDLFFIMSGFVIRHVYGDNFTHGVTWSRFNKFIIARFARIYPLHFFTLTFLIAETLFTGEWNWVNDPAVIPANLLLLQSFGVTALSTWNRQSWSISAEWTAYMAFPLLAVFFYRKSWLAYSILPFLIILTYIALLYWLPPAGIGNADRLQLHKLDVTYDYGFLRGIAGFTLGMLCYGAYKQDRLRILSSKDSTAGICIVGILFCMHKGVNDLIIVITFTGLVLCVASNGGTLHKFLSFVPLQYVGKVSYSIYLLQGLVITWFISSWKIFVHHAKLPPLWTIAIVPRLSYNIAYILMLVTVSSITYYGIEKPFRNYINRKYAHFARVKEQKLVSSGLKQ